MPADNLAHLDRQNRSNHLPGADPHSTASTRITMRDEESGVEKTTSSLGKLLLGGIGISILVGVASIGISVAVTALSSGVITGSLAIIVSLPVALFLVASICFCIKGFNEL